jgi:exopolyphosphatase/guanosine-5'-triphosphate,3'-diphosphate pyrophosphatase
MTIATIDIGTNTVLLLIASMDVSGNITPLAYEQRVPRLGAGVDLHRSLRPDSMQRVVRVLREYQRIMAQYTLDTVKVFGTSAVRDAANEVEFRTLIRQHTGLELEILSGDEEARWTYRGAVSGVPYIDSATVVDIGGGSTEITSGTRQQIVRRVSLDIGSVRLTERFFRHDPPLESELDDATALVRRELENTRAFDAAGSTLVGVAGTATSLAVLAQGQREFSLQAVTNFRLTSEIVEQLYAMLRHMPSSRIATLSAVMEGRSDVITSGTLILRELMSLHGFNEMIVSERGVRYGIAIREWEKKHR